MKRIKPKPSENGITLIALVIMIIILVILAAVGIRALTGKNNLIGTTETAAEDYNITSYKEQIMQQVRSIIIAHANLGEEIGITQIAEELNEETIWVKSAIANTDTTVTNEDIIVKVTDGYVFQVYYNNVYGTVFVEYIGKDKSPEPPNIKARYEKSIASIVYEVTDPSSEIEKVEVIYRGEVKYTEEKPGVGEKRYNISEVGTGWYILKVTSSSGKLRYAWVKGNNISDKLTPPVISIEPVSPNGEAGWYKTGVKVTMTTDSPSAKEIRYRTVTGIANEEGESQTGEGTKYNGVFEFGTNGSTTIYAWTADDKGYVSEEAKVSFKIDSIKPTIVNPARITPTKPQVNGWYVSGLEIEIEGADEGSGLNGYYYMIKGEDTEWKFKSKEETMKIDESEREGITEIDVKTVDAAGNESNEITIKIPKDTVKPNFNNIEITEEGTTSFTVNAYATDPSPSSTINGEKITYECYITEVGTSTKTQIDKGKTNETGIFNVTGLKAQKSYDVEIVAKDPAGNTASSSARGTTKGELLAPHIDIKGTTRNGYYIGDVTITITDTASTETSSATKIKYNQNGTEVIKDGKSYTYTITADGTYKIVAYMQDGTGATSAVSNEINFTKDTTLPTAPTIEPSGSIQSGSEWYKGQVAVRITPGTDNGSGVYGVRYIVSAPNAIGPIDVETTTSASTNITEEGTTTITAYTIDKAGNISGAATKVIKLDKTAPNAPTVSIKSGTSVYGNDWYNSNVTVSITAGTDGSSGAYQLKYSTNSGVNYTTETLTSKEINITADGTNEIRAYTIDRAGNESITYGSKTVNKDTQVPTITSTSYSPATTTTITANIAANDGTGSGIHHYQFYLDNVDKGTSTTTTTTISANMGTYTAKAVAYDNAGNVSLAATDSARTQMYAWSKWNTSTITTSSITCAKLTQGNQFMRMPQACVFKNFSGFLSNRKT